MKNYMFFLLILFFVIPPYSNAEEFLEAPVIPGAKETRKTDARLELQTRMSHDDVLTFYKGALKELKDIKFREWVDSTYIEDDGNRPWHSITISKGDGEETRVTIVKDNWTWIIGTLVLRYIGVFMVLMILFLGMTISGKIISASIKKMEAKKEEG